MTELLWALLFALGFLVAIRVCSLLAEHTSGRLRQAIFYPLGTLAFLIAGAGPLVHWYVASDPSFLYAILGLLWWIQVALMLFGFGNPNGKFGQLMDWEISVVDRLRRVLTAVLGGCLLAILFVPMQLFLIAKILIASVFQRESDDGDDAD